MMTKKWVLATGNVGKVNEMNHILNNFKIEVVPQSDFNVLEAEETGTTFVENAIIKAKNASQATGLPAIADDSGLEVDFLKGQPGIYSSRFSGDDATDKTNIILLLDKLKGVEKEKRTARFQCVLVFMRHAKDPTPIICQGTWEGAIATELSGENGFGYDPVFWLEEHGVTSAQLSKSEKYELSHRGQALRSLISRLGTELD